MSVQLSRTLCAASFFTIVAGAGAALAAGSHAGAHGHGDTVSFGRPGKAAEADRTVEIVMADNFFEPDRLAVRAGETVRFVIRNEGDLLHEFNLGTAAMHAAHQEEMAMMMEHGMLTPTGIDHGKMGHDGGSMTHDDPNAALVEPGQTTELVWTFAAAKGLAFACNVPGHYEAGMVGEIDFMSAGDTGN